ncbi:MAG: SDR family NAD(P)-dependent oxidoreductase [Azospirillum sp.]|nr:SDR family NAD(P)-dependent oxidoreductase [Azospirillum sp.]
MPTVLITGSNRGLGLEFVRQYAAAGWTVVATAREPGRADALRALARGGRVTVIPLDVGDAGAVAALAGTTAVPALDLLINNAGVYGAESATPESLDFVDWQRVLDINTLGPLRVSLALLGRLRAGRGRTVVTITSQMGSIADNRSGGYYAYRSSKAALNAAMRSLALDLRPEGFTVALLHPGWVRTDMGGPAAPMAISDSIAALRRTIDGLTPAKSGKFLNYDGRELPW